MNEDKTLIVVSCGKKKSETLINGHLAASKAYTGPMFQVINKAKRENRWPPNFFLGILSAKYGFLRENDCIEYYDEKMTLKRASELNNQTIKAIKAWHSEEKFSLIYILMGKIYLTAVKNLESTINTTVVIEPMGGLGIGQKKLVHFLEIHSRNNED